MPSNDAEQEDEFEWAEHDSDSLTEQSTGTDWPTFSRRRILKLAGTGATAATLSTGAATAHDRVYTEADENQPGTSEDVDTLVDRMTLEEKTHKVHNHLEVGTDSRLAIWHQLPGSTCLTWN